MSNDVFKIEVNGEELEAKPGQMLIQVTDAAGIYIPRFCYHEKLSVAANCRMCLVEVEKAPKPLPACATPVADGMKVFTRSANAIAAQKAVMEFLLINHPLDCPICDQGGECELQDLAMGYGRDVSRYVERKRVVRDKNLGPLVSTDMTRCIHCTRCVRFGQEIAGIQELGTIGRGDRTEISTYIERSVDHELSGNIIDLCPVGALNSKPYRFSARAWEMVQRETIAPHDCFGSNLFAHVMNGKVKRMVPKANEAINETWLSDRDRFSYEAIYAADRLQRPMVRSDDGWREIAWEDALKLAADRLRDARGDVAALLSPGSTTEEAWLLGRLVRHLDSADIDHRVRRRDFRHQDQDPLFPWAGMDWAAVEACDSILLVGAPLRQEVPMLAHRVRKAALNGARVSVVDIRPSEYLFTVAAQTTGRSVRDELAGVVVAALDGQPASAAVVSLIEGHTASADHVAVCATLRGDAGLILIGHRAQRDPQFAEIRALVGELARLTGCRVGYVAEGANAAGACLAGALPHREAGGKPAARPGRDAAAIAGHVTGTLILFGLEPGLDCVPLAASDERFVIACSPYLSQPLREAADLVLPIGTFAETAGTFVNGEGRWQHFEGVASPVGESRPGWKVLRVLGNLCELSDCEYLSAADVRKALQAELGEVTPDNSVSLDVSIVGQASEGASDDVPLYQVDMLVRRAPALQQVGQQQRGEPRKIA